MFKFKLKLSQSLKIIIGLILGLLFGIIGVSIGLQPFIVNWISPWGEIFIKLLKMLAIPIILTSLIKGIYDLKVISGLKKLATTVIVFYFATTMVAVILGVFLVVSIKPGNFFPSNKKEILIEKYSKNIAENENKKIENSQQKPLQFIVDIVPENIFESTTKNNQMLKVIFISILIGISILLLPENKTSGFRNFVDSANEIILKIVEIVMKFAAIGVFAIICGVIADISDENIYSSFLLLKSLGVYALTVILGLIILILIIYPIIIKILGKKNIISFYRGILPAQLMAFSTSSSAATLPITKKCVDENLKIPDKISSFVLPIGATVNMDGTSLYQAIAAIFIAQVFGLDLSIYEIILLIFTSVLASVGAAAVPGAGMIILLIVLSSVNIPAEGLALIFAVDRPLDMLRTSVNITGDCACAVVTNRFL